MPAKRKGNRKNRKIKFSEANYVEKNFMRRGKAVIPIELKSVNDLYMKHDYKKMELSDEVCAYIEEIAYMIPINTDIVLEIHCPEVDEETQAKIKKSIKNNYGIEIDDVEYDLNTNYKKAGIFAVLGVVLLVINLLLDRFELFSNFLSVIWWVFIWDMVEILAMDNSEMKWKRLNYQQLYDATYEFVFDNDIEIDEKYKGKDIVE